MTVDVSLIPQNRIENLISKLTEIENNIGNIGTDITNNVVHKNGNETIIGTKTFNNEIIFNAIPVFNGGKNDSTEGGEIHIASTPNEGWDKDTTTIDEQDGGIRFFNFKNNQIYGYRFDLNDGKGLPKARMVVDAYKSGTSWYRVWSDGWIEQGGAWGTNTGAWAEASVTYLKAYKDTNYQLFVQGNWSSADCSSCKITSRSTAGFTGTYANNLYSVMPSWWYACGY